MFLLFLKFSFHIIFLSKEIMLSILLLSILYFFGYKIGVYLSKIAANIENNVA